jgi:hypothetical protein
VSARTIGSRAAAVLRPDVSGRVLGSFARACDLVTDGDEVVALVWDGIGNGPLNVVLPERQVTPPPAGARFRGAGGVLSVDGLAVDLAPALTWDARPDWDALRARYNEIVAAADAARRSISGLCEQRLLKQAGPAVEAAVAAFQRAWQKTSRTDSQSAIRNLQSAICHLLGLGPGLTPAGDDWLAGWLLAQHLAPDLTGLRDLSGLITKAAATHTTTLSRAFLACAAAGEADEDWHGLLAGLSSESANQRIANSKSANQRIGGSIQRILAHGATSGAAMLAGFLSGIDHLPEPPSARLLDADERKERG